MNIIHFIVDQIFFLIVNPYQFPVNSIKKTIPITFGTRITRSLQHMSKQFIIAFFIFNIDAIQQDISLQHWLFIEYIAVL